MNDNKEKPLVIYMMAGEPSGDFLGAQLIKSLRANSQREILFYGIGGKKMEAEGLKSIFPYHELSIMGIFEIIPNIFRILAHISSTVADIIIKQPDMVITIDSPGFCFRVVEKLRKENFKSRFIHYVAPTVWAYKPERAKKCKALFDHILLLLPFEAPYFEKVGLNYTFVGHPIICESLTGDNERFRQKYEIPQQTILISLLPGSRENEIKRHMPIFTKAIAILANKYPDIALTMSVPEHVKPLLGKYLNDCPFRIIMTVDEQDKQDAFAASDFAFVKSGTVSLEVAKAGTPMLISYKMNSLSVWWLKRYIKIKYVNLINIILNKEVIPEILQEQATPIALASCADNILSNPELMKRQRNHMSTAIKRLIPENNEKPSDIAAQNILGTLSQQS
ncbi:MAG: lipid-A-disaccharide synthase [Rickettsiales bacterium]